MYLAGLFLVCGDLYAQSPAGAAYNAANEAIRSAELAGLVGTAEGMYRGCKASRDMRAGAKPEGDLVLALDLASVCESYMRGVATTLALSDRFSVGDVSCFHLSSVSDLELIDALVSSVINDPLLIGKDGNVHRLTRSAIVSLPYCE